MTGNLPDKYITDEDDPKKINYNLHEIYSDEIEVTDKIYKYPPKDSG